MFGCRGGGMEERMGSEGQRTVTLHVLLSALREHRLESRCLAWSYTGAMVLGGFFRACCQEFRLWNGWLCDLYRSLNDSRFRFHIWKMHVIGSALTTLSVWSWSQSCRTSFWVRVAKGEASIGRKRHCLKVRWCSSLRAFLVAQMVKSVCNVGDSGSIPGSGGSPEKGMATHSSILSWRIPWTEEPGGLQST